MGDHLPINDGYGRPRMLHIRITPAACSTLIIAVRALQQASCVFAGFVGNDSAVPAGRISVSIDALSKRRRHSTDNRCPSSHVVVVLRRITLQCTISSSLFVYSRISRESQSFDSR